MKKLLPVMTLSILCSTAILATTALAEEKKIVGPVTKVQLGTPTGKATVTVKDGKTGLEAKLIVSDEGTLDKLKNKKINDGDEVRAKYDTATGDAKSLKRTAGCD